MTVYVDPPQTWNDRFPNYCHMWADSIEELHEFATKLRLKRTWFQHQRRGFPHYDVSQGKRYLALQMGALPVTSADMVKWVHENERKNGWRK